jgi:hypothetical protein
MLSISNITDIINFSYKKNIWIFGSNHLFFCDISFKIKYITTKVILLSYLFYSKSKCTVIILYIEHKESK